MRRLAGWMFVLGLAGSAPMVFAQAEGEKGGHAKSEEAGEEQEGSLVWKWANFALLAGALGYVLAKNAGPFFTERTLKIRKGMIEAEEMRAEAEAQVAAVDARLANLQAEIEAMRKEALAEGAAEAERVRRDTAAELAKIQAHAEQEIASLGKAARLELKRHTARLAISLAEQKIRSRITPENEASLVRQFVKEMAQSAPPAQAS